MGRRLVHGWQDDRQDDGRDWKYAERRPRVARYPDAADVLGLEPSIWDQEQLGSCTIHGALRVLEVEQARHGRVPVPLNLSPLMGYYTGRSMEGTIGQDSGCEIRDVIRGLAKVGCCRQELWPYYIDKFAQQPPSDCYTDALAHMVRSYSALRNSDPTDLWACLANHEAFTFGFEVPAAFEGDEIAETGILNDPPSGWTSIGGHAVAATKYDRSVRFGNWSAPGGFLISNSYGREWGCPEPDLRGHFWVSEKFICSGACSSFWHLSPVEYGPSPTQET